MITGTARTEDEIEARADEIKDEDFFGVHRMDLVSALSFERARAGDWLREDATEEAWLADPETPAEAIRDYLPFAIGKAQDHRGMSAGRSIDHMRAWVWLMGDEAYESIDWDDYPQYGMPILKRIADLVGYQFPVDEDVVRMSQGRPCEDDCMAGCGA